MPKRNLANPQSMVGVTAEEFLAMKPPGWLVRPLPGDRPGFRMISPDKMPGAYGTLTYYDSGSPDWVSFPAKPAPWLFALNSATEHQLLVQILAAWALPAESPGAAVSDIPFLADATQRLIRDGLIRVYLDPLDSDAVRPLEEDEAVSAVAGPGNWWRDDNNPAVEAATSILAIGITVRGQMALTAAARPRPRIWPWRKRRS